MSDNLRRYRVIRQALKQCYSGEPSDRMARHLQTLAAFISGVILYNPSDWCISGIVRD